MLAALAGLLIVGCGDDDDEAGAPVACLGGTDRRAASSLRWGRVW